MPPGVILGSLPPQRVGHKEPHRQRQRSELKATNVQRKTRRATVPMPNTTKSLTKSTHDTRRYMRTTARAEHIGWPTDSQHLASPEHRVVSESCEYDARRLGILHACCPPPWMPPAVVLCAWGGASCAGVCAPTRLSPRHGRHQVNHIGRPVWLATTQH